MKREEILKLLEQVGAVRTGHFELSSGPTALRTSNAPWYSNILSTPSPGRALADLFKDLSLACVVSPALGGILAGYEVARALGVRSLFVERDRSGQMALRRDSKSSPVNASW